MDPPGGRRGSREGATPGTSYGATADGLFARWLRDPNPAIYRCLIERSIDGLDEIARQERRLAGLAIPVDDLTDEFAARVFTTLDIAPGLSFWDWARHEIRFAAQTRLIPLLPSGGAPTVRSDEAAAFYKLGLLDRQLLVAFVMEEVSSYEVAEWFGWDILETERAIEAAQLAYEAHLTGTMGASRYRAVELVDELMRAYGMLVPGALDGCEFSRRPRHIGAVVDDIEQAVRGDPDLRSLPADLYADLAPIDAVERLAAHHRRLGGYVTRRAMLLANLYLTLGRARDAERALQEIESLPTEPVGRRAFARTSLRCLVVLDEFDEALALLDSLPPEDHDHALLPYYRAGVHALRGQRSEYLKAAARFRACPDARASFVRRTVIRAAPALAPPIGITPARLLEDFGVHGVPPSALPH